MHHIHHTTAYVLSHRNSGEADRIFRLFVRDIGVISAKATGIRKQSSKLRFALQEGSYVTIDLVRGKDIWRVTSASPQKGLALLIGESQKMFVRALKLIKRLAGGETAHELVFDDLDAFFETLYKEQLTDETLLAGEALFVLRVLHHLGYWGDDERFLKYSSGLFVRGLLDEMVQDRKKIVPMINESLRATHL